MNAGSGFLFAARIAAPPDHDRAVGVNALGLALPFAWKEAKALGVAVKARFGASPHASLPKRTTCPLRNANEALADLRAGRIDGTAVLVPRGPFSIRSFDASQRRERGRSS